MEKNGALAIKIGSVNNWRFHAGGLMIICTVFIGGCWLFVPALFRVKTLTEAFSITPFIGFWLLWCGIGFRIVLERLCTIELFAGGGIFRWSYRIMSWGKDIEARQEDITAVVAKARWYGNRLSVTMNGKTYFLSNLLHEDLTIITRELHKALPHLRSLADAAG